MCLGEKVNKNHVWQVANCKQKYNIEVMTFAIVKNDKADSCTY